MEGIPQLRDYEELLSLDKTVLDRSRDTLTGFNSAEKEILADAKANEQLSRLNRCRSRSRRRVACSRS